MNRPRRPEPRDKPIQYDSAPSSSNQWEPSNNTVQSILTGVLHSSRCNDKRFLKGHWRPQVSLAKRLRARLGVPPNRQENRKFANAQHCQHLRQARSPWGVGPRGRHPRVARTRRAHRPQKMDGLGGTSHVRFTPTDAGRDSATVRAQWSSAQQRETRSRPFRSDV